MLIDQCLVKSSSEKLSPLINGSKCTELQDDMLKVRALKSISLKWDSFHQTPTFRAQGSMCNEDEAENLQKP